MSELLSQGRVSAHVALITFSAPRLLDEYRPRHELTIPILSDPERRTYRAYGLGRGSLTEVWGWKTVRRYAQILRRPDRSLRELTSTTEDTRQLGGDMIIAPDGTLAWGHWSEGPADRPDPDRLLAILADLARP